MQELKSGYQRLDDQILWYDTKSRICQFWYKNLKVATIIFASMIPLASTVMPGPWASGVLGAGVLILEGLQQINQYHHNWMIYRSTCERLRHEKYLYLAKADSYQITDEEKAFKILAERVEDIVSTEHGKWMAKRQNSERGSETATPRS